MTAVGARLRRLEQRSQAAASTSIRIFWPEQFTPCLEHPRCDVEIATGDHRHGVIHTSFEAPQS